MSPRSRPYVRRTATLQERLDYYTDKSAGAGGCWLWTGSASSNGYGKLRWQGRTRRAHRLAFEAANGYVLATVHVLHRCDNPLCVNPAHLFAGSHLDNMRDMYSKGRRPPPVGELNGNAKLTAEMVLVIRAATCLQREIAARFGISRRTVQCIKRGDAWRHLPPVNARLAGPRMQCSATTGAAD